MWAGIIGALIGAVAVLGAVLYDSYLRRRSDRIREFEVAVFNLYRNLLYFRSNHTHILKWDEDKNSHRDIRGYPGYCDNEHPNYLLAIQKFRSQRLDIVDLLREIKTLEVRGHTLDESLTDILIRGMFGYTYSSEAQRYKDLETCTATLRKEWPTIDDQLIRIGEENERLLEENPVEYERRFRIVEGPDEEVY